MKLSKKQIDQLWGDKGPYSQVHLTFESRILDDAVSRVFIIVNVSINPLTFEIISKNLKHFKDDKMVLALIEHAVYRDQFYGYEAVPFTMEYFDESILKKGKQILEETKTAIIQMHKFVMDLLELSND